MTSFKVGEGVGCFYTPGYNMGISAEQGGEERVRKDLQPESGSGLPSQQMEA